MKTRTSALVVAGVLALAGAARAQLPVEPIGRCRAPDANPETGERDVLMLKTLETHWNTRNFGVYFKVAAPGTIHVGDTLQ